MLNFLDYIRKLMIITRGVAQQGVAGVKEGREGDGEGGGMRLECSMFRCWRERGREEKRGRTWRWTVEEYTAIQMSL